MWEDRVRTSFWTKSNDTCACCKRGSEVVMCVSKEQAIIGISWLMKFTLDESDNRKTTARNDKGIELRQGLGASMAVGTRMHESS